MTVARSTKTISLLAAVALCVPVGAALWLSSAASAAAKISCSAPEVETTALGLLKQTLENQGLYQATATGYAIDPHSVRTGSVDPATGATTCTATASWTYPKRVTIIWHDAQFTPATEHGQIKEIFLSPGCS